MIESPMTIIAQINYLVSKAVLNHPTVNLGKPELNIYMGINTFAKLRKQMDSIYELEIIEFKIRNDRAYYDNNPIFLVDDDNHLFVAVR